MSQEFRIFKYAVHGEIKELRIKKQMPQRQIAPVHIDATTYCEIEKGERKAKGEQSVSAKNLKSSY